MHSLQFVSEDHMYKGSMDKDNGGEDSLWVSGVGRAGENNGEKMGARVIE